MDDVELRLYADLDQAARKAFLDIGCFFVGEEEKLTIEILNGLHGIESEGQLEKLRARGLVDLKCKKCEDPGHGGNYSCGSLKAITMPKTMEDLARTINRKESPPLRLASSNEMHNFMENANVPTDFDRWVSGKPPPKIYGIRIPFSDVPTYRRVIVEGLRLFVAEDLPLPTAFFDSWKISGALLWLRLFKLRGSLCFPSSISLETLRVLELDGSPDGVKQFMRNSACDAGRRKSIFDFFPRGGSVQSIFSIWKQNSVFQYLKAKNRVRGMEDLTKLELKNIKSIQSLPINFSLLGNLTTLDVSGCVGLTALPSTSKTLSRLQYLVNLKFLNISKCSKLKTLNVQGLTSLEEIKADACWNLKKIDDLDSLDRLNCLHISTDNNLMWTVIKKYLSKQNTSAASQQNLSTAIFSGKADNGKVVDTKKIKQIGREFDPEIEICDFTDGLRLNLHGGAIMMFFIIDEGQDDSSPEFCLTFTPTNNDSALEYRTARANGGGRSLNVFMWTEGSHLFQENNADGIHVRCSLQRRINPGLIVRFHQNTSIPNVCAKIIKEYLD